MSVRTLMRATSDFAEATGNMLRGRPEYKIMSIASKVDQLIDFIELQDSLQSKEGFPGRTGHEYDDAARALLDDLAFGFRVVLDRFAFDHDVHVPIKLWLECRSKDGREEAHSVRSGLRKCAETADSTLTSAAKYSICTMLDLLIYPESELSVTASQPQVQMFFIKAFVPLFEWWHAEGLSFEELEENDKDRAFIRERVGCSSDVTFAQLQKIVMELPVKDACVIVNYALNALQPRPRFERVRYRTNDCAAATHAKSNWSSFWMGAFVVSALFTVVNGIRRAL